MNLLLITTTYPTPTRPRQGAFNLTLVEALQARHDVRVIAPIPWPQTNWSLIRRRSSDASLTRGPAATTAHPVFVYPPKAMRPSYDRFYWRSIRRAVSGLEKSFRPDLVISYWLHPDGAAAIRAAKRFDVPCVAISGGSDLRLLAENPARRPGIVNTLRQSDQVIVVSRELAARAESLGINRDKINVIYRGVNRKIFHATDQAKARAKCGIDPDTIVVFWAGRFEPVKNPEMLLEASSQWQRQWGNRLRVLMAGDGSMRNQLVRRCQELGLDDVVRFEGNLTPDELQYRYNAADVTVLTSHSEGVPNVLLESIACDVPFVATDVGGVSEIATHGLDQLVPDGDTAALIHAVVRRVASAPLAPRVFRPGGPNEMAKRFEEVFARVVTRPEERPPVAAPRFASSPRFITPPVEVSQ